MTPILLAGCATPALYEDINRPEYREYTETVSQILISQDNKNIVILGAEHHYIVDAPKDLVAAMHAGFQSGLRAKFTPFTVDREGDLDGELELRLAGTATPEERQDARRMGFYPYGGKDDAAVMRNRYTIHGKRYAAGKFALPPLARPLNQTYAITVREQKPVGGKAALALLTPVTLAADGVLVILAVPLIPVAAIMLRDMRFM